MIIHAYCCSYNEEDLLPYYLRHYSTFCSKITILDNESTDASIDIIQAFSHGLRQENSSLEVVCRSFNSDNQYQEDVLTHHRNTMWKESKGIADFVVVSDVDEHLFHPQLKEFLFQHKRKGTTVFRPKGYMMLSPHFPTIKGLLVDEVQQGVRDYYIDKCVLFDPNAIEEINFGNGSHEAEPTGNVLFYDAVENSEALNPFYDHSGESILKLLHYHWMGIEKVNNRNALINNRVSELGRINHWGLHYAMSSEEVERIFEKNWNLSTNVVNPCVLAKD
ncbi:MAG: glycosyltransferase family 2 protein [Cyanobacteria bacterium]|nr:glycosyltransferase family 2 protein [Cyanobacteriota bacterium]